MQQRHFRGGSPSGQARQFQYRGKPSGKGGFSHGGKGNHGGGYRGSSRGGSRGGGFSKHIDISKFVNKAVITEKVEHYTPEHAFTDFDIDNRLKTNIATKGYFVPTPIQDKSIPHILKGSDIVGIANTGTGKTAAFLIPLINKILKSPNERVLIIVPTRELAQQIEVELRAFTTHLNMRSVCCVGGAGIGFQIKNLSGRPHFVIGTPGRLRDLIDRGRIQLGEFSTVVLDEADRMLDMGFIGEVKFMISKMPAKRHTLFFSATMSKEIEALISSFLNSPVMVSVKTGDTPAAVDQDIVKVPLGKNKFDVLTDMLKQAGFDKILIFGKTKHGVQRLAEQLSQIGLKAESIHGNKSQPQRAKALSLFKEHHTKILVATDVAARGLDIAGVSHVINYDIPATYEDYVHRIGRTGRGGKKGKALTFV